MKLGKTLEKYGTEQLATLKKVLVHRPVHSLSLVNEGNYSYYLFNKAPDVQKWLEEHASYVDLLRSLGVEVYELSHYIKESEELMNNLPNLPYLHDSSVVSSHGAILSKMCPGGRQDEDIVVKEALQNLGIPIFYEFDRWDQFEGCLLLSPKTILIADTERHTPKSISKFIPKALEIFPEVIYVHIPQKRRFMHPDMVYNRISKDLSLVYLPAFLQVYQITKESSTRIEFKPFMEKRGIELINISDEEQQNWGCSFLPLKPKVIIHYDLSLSPKTQKILSRKGVEIIEFHPDALLSGGGSLRCLTLRLLRE